MVGYATAYTMLPVFSLVLDRDVNEDVALLYPELYKELTKVSSSSVSASSSMLILFPGFAGPLTLVQDLLHLAHDLFVSRYALAPPEAPSIADLVSQAGPS